MAARWLPPTGNRDPGLRMHLTPTDTTPWLLAPAPTSLGRPPDLPPLSAADLPGDPWPWHVAGHSAAGLAHPLSLPMPEPLAVPPPASRTATRPPLQLKPARVTVVRTATELQEAAADGAVDIEIRRHLDFRELRAGPNPLLADAAFSFYGIGDGGGDVTVGGFRDRFLVFALPPTRSIRVRLLAVRKPIVQSVYRSGIAMMQNLRSIAMLHKRNSFKRAPGPSGFQQRCRRERQPHAYQCRAQPLGGQQPWL